MASSGPGIYTRFLKQLKDLHKVSQAAKEV